MSDALNFSKNLLQLVLSPARGWDDVAEHEAASQRLMEKGFYPLLALVGISAFIQGLYGLEPFSYARQLQIAITQVVSLFLSLMIARGLFENVLPRLSDIPVDVSRTSTVCIYCLSMMALIKVIINLCPVDLVLLNFLPAFVAMVAWQSRDFLGVSRQKQSVYVIFAVTVLVILPLLIEYILGLLIVR